LITIDTVVRINKLQQGTFMPIKQLLMLLMMTKIIKICLFRV